MKLVALALVVACSGGGGDTRDPATRCKQLLVTPLRELKPLDFAHACAPLFEPACARSLADARAPITREAERDISRACGEPLHDALAAALAKQPAFAARDADYAARAIVDDVREPPLVIALRALPNGGATIEIDGAMRAQVSATPTANELAPIAADIRRGGRDVSVLEWGREDAPPSFVATSRVAIRAFQDAVAKDRKLAWVSCRRDGKNCR